MIDWDDAEECLHGLANGQLGRFLNSPERDDVYGLGFFCDVLEGVMLVANTRSYHDASFRQYAKRGGMCDEETFRWDIGNWKYPGGFASSTDEQVEFDDAWQRFAGSLSESDDDRDRELLEELCIKVLRRLSDDGVFSIIPGLEGFTVLGPDDPPDDILPKKYRLDALLKTSSD